MKFKTLSDFEFKNKTVILRIDINSEIKNKKPIFSDRFVESSKTIIELKRKKAKVIVLAHQGKPNSIEFISLKQHAKILNKLTKIKFIPDIIGKKALRAIKFLKPGEAILLENIRYLSDELSPGKNNKIINTLAPLADIYINDAFSVCHRAQTSITEFPKVLPSGIGRLMEKELSSLNKLKLKNALFILGGTKLEEVLPLLKDRKVLAGSYLGALCLLAQGKKIGKQESLFKSQLSLMKEINPHLSNIALPVDYAVNKNDKRKNISISKLPSNYPLLDIGDKTISLYVAQIKKAKAIFLKGPLGMIEKPQFKKGTKEILKAMSSSKSFTALAGGHTTTIARELGINKKHFSYISISGGALLSYISGKKLPGLEALEKGVK